MAKHVNIREINDEFNQKHPSGRGGYIIAECHGHGNAGCRGANQEGQGIRISVHPIAATEYTGPAPVCDICEPVRW